MSSDRAAEPPAPTSTASPAGPPPPHGPSPALWDGYCADPFVIRGADGRFVMYGTTMTRPGGRAFQMLVSSDLDCWEDAGGALVVDDAESPDTQYWAPEVAFADGRYWMYYSRGIGDAGHQLRVATASEATGPFQDTGDVLTPHLPFAIDPSPFQDSAGAWWLYFATDLVEGDRPGTVLAVQRLRDMTSLEGPLTIVLRATADWQRYQADREMYGGRHDWHTLEGPALLDDGEGGLLMLYSGGNWQTSGYGVAVAAAPAPGGPWREDVAQGPVVTSASSGLIGPGHCSVLTADGVHHVFIHAWDPGVTRRRPHRMVLQLDGGHVFVSPSAWVAS